MLLKSLPLFCGRLFSAMPVVSNRWKIEVRKFHEKSSQDSPNSNEFLVLMTFGFFYGSRNFRRLFSVSWEVFVLHGNDCNHWVANSCTTTACRWLFRNSPPSVDSVVWDSPDLRWSSPLKSSLLMVCSWQSCWTICYWEFEFISFIVSSIRLPR